LSWLTTLSVLRVTTDPNKIDFTLFWTTLTASGPVAWPIAVSLAVGLMALLLAMAWRLVRRQGQKF
jgi:hypothetical protein